MNDHRPPSEQQTGVTTHGFTEGNAISSTHTIRPAVKALFSNGPRILLIKERRSDGTTFWTLPGGGVEPEETLSQALRRELSEELGCIARISGKVGRCRYRHRRTPNLVSHYTIFSARLLTRLTPNPAEQVLEYEWVTPAELPARTLRPIRRFVTHYCDSDASVTHTTHPDRSM